MAKTLDILFGVKGGSSISEGSGKIIYDQLKGIANEIASGNNKDILILGLNKSVTKDLITKQLNDIIGQIKTNALNIDLTINGKKWDGSGNGGSGGGSKYDATRMVNALTRQMSGFTAQGKLPEGSDMRKSYEQLLKELQAPNADLKQLSERWKDLNQQMRNFGTESNAAVKQANLLRNVTDYLKDYGDALKTADPDVYKKISDLADKLGSGAFNPEELKKFIVEFKNLTSEANNEAPKIIQFLGTLSERIKHFAITLALAALRKAIHEVYTNVVQLDKAVTDLQIASGKTRDEVKGMVKEYSQLAQELGTTTTVVAQGADTWLRQGYAAAEATELLADSTKLAVLGQMDAKEASTALTSAMKGYKKEVSEAIGIVDKFTAVDMQAAASAGDIATAMAETAVSANNTGVSMDKLIGYLTVVKEVTQDGAESVGTFYKTLFARMGNIKAGKYVSDEGEDLNDTEKVLKKNGILLRDSTNEFRNFGSVLDEVASKWQNFDSVTQHAIATAFAGTRQQEKFFVLMENYGTALEYEAVAAESAGTANKKYTEAYLDSIEARKNAMTAAYESLSQTILNSEAIKTAYEWITVIINALDYLLNDQLGGALVRSTALFALVYKGIPFLVSGLQNIKQAISAIIPNILSMTTATDGAAVSAAALSSAWQGVFAIVGLAIALITAITGAIKRYQQEQHDANLAAIESWKQGKDNADQLRKLYDQYRKLRPETAEYKSVEEKLLELLGDKTEALEGLTKGTDDYREAILNLTEAELNEAMVRSANSAEAATKEVSKRHYFDYAGLEEYGDVQRDMMLLGYSDSSDPNSTRRALSSMFSSSGKSVLQYNLDTFNAVNNAKEQLIKSAREDLRTGKITVSEYKNRLRSQLLKMFDTYLAESRSSIEDFFESNVAEYVQSFLLVNDLSGLYNKEDLDAAKEFVKDNFYDSFDIKASDFVTTMLTSAVDKWFEEAASNKTESIAEVWQTLSDTLNSDELKNATSAVSELSSAIEEMDGSGRISLDTAQKLAELGEEYVNAITVENGALRVNTDILRSLTIKKLEDARATAIQNNATAETIKLYDKLIADAKKLGSGDYLDRALSLREYKDTILEFAGGADYDNIRLEDYYRNIVDIRKQIEYLRNNGAGYDDPELMEKYKQYIEYSEKWLALQKEIIGNDNDAYKESIEKQNEALDKQKDLLDDILDARKKALQLTKDENSYQKELASKQKKVADLQTQLITARLDTSASGRARVRALESELQKAQEELDDFNLEHAIDIVSDKLDAEREENESIYQRQKANNEALLNAYITEHEAELKDLKDKLLEDYDIVGTALGNLATEENNVVSELQGIDATIQKIEEKIGKDNLASQGTEHFVTDYYWNGKGEDYWRRKEEQVYGKIEKHHSGGIVSDLKLKDNETFAKLMKGEYVATPEQMSRFLNSTLPKMASVKPGNEFYAPLVSIQVDSVNNETMPKLEALVKRAADKIKSDITSAFDKTGYRGTTKKVLSY